jgi:hypothetical protein
LQEVRRVDQQDGYASDLAAAIRKHRPQLRLVAVPAASGAGPRPPESANSHAAWPPRAGAGD